VEGKVAVLADAPANPLAVFKDAPWRTNAVFIFFFFPLFHHLVNSG
jgi:hypothetical protein